MQEYRFEKNLSCVIFVLLFLGLAAEIPITFLNLYRMQEMAYLSFWDKIGHILSSFWYGGNAFAMLLSIGYFVLRILVLKQIFAHTLQEHETQWLLLLPASSLIVPIFNVMSAMISIGHIKQFGTALGEYLLYRIPETVFLLLIVLVYARSAVELKHGRITSVPVLAIVLLVITVLSDYVFTNFVSFDFYHYRSFTWDSYLSLIILAERTLWWLLTFRLFRLLQTEKLPFPAQESLAKPRLYVRFMIICPIVLYLFLQLVFLAILRF